MSSLYSSYSTVIVVVAAVAEQVVVTTPHVYNEIATYDYKESTLRPISAF